MKQLRQKEHFDFLKFTFPPSKCQFKLWIPILVRRLCRSVWTNWWWTLLSPRWLLSRPRLTGAGDQQQVGSSSRSPPHLRGQISDRFCIVHRVSDAFHLQPSQFTKMTITSNTQRRKCILKRKLNSSFCIIFHKMKEVVLLISHMRLFFLLRPKCGVSRRVCVW